MYNHVLSYCSTVIVHGAWSLVAVFATLHILWAVLMYYKQCGLADDSVMENINKLQILSFFLFFTSVY